MERRNIFFAATTHEDEIAFQLIPTETPPGPTPRNNPARSAFLILKASFFFFFFSSSSVSWVTKRFRILIHVKLKLDPYLHLVMGKRTPPWDKFSHTPRDIPRFLAAYIKLKARNVTWFSKLVSTIKANYMRDTIIFKNVNPYKSHLEQIILNYH